MPEQKQPQTRQLLQQQAAIADLERATMEARLAAGTQNATAADLAKTMAAERVAATANAAVTVAANAEAAAIARATTATAANTAAATASATAQTALSHSNNTSDYCRSCGWWNVDCFGRSIRRNYHNIRFSRYSLAGFGDNAETAAEKQ